MKITELDIERYIRFPKKLSASSRKSIELAIEENQELREFYHWFSQFYLFYDKIIKTTDPIAFSKPVFSIELKPMHSIEKKENRLFILAAQTSAISKKRIESVKTFFSAEQSTIMRVLWDNKKESTLIHILSEKISESDIALLHIPGSDLLLVSKPGGRLEISTHQINRDIIKEWAACKVILPVITTKFKPNIRNCDSFFPAKSPNGMITVEVVSTDKYVVFTPLIVEDTLQLSNMVLHTPDGSSLWHLQNGKAFIPKDQLTAEEVVLHFYNEYVSI